MPLILDSPPNEQHDPREERRRVHHEADVLVVGAGILGCAIAITMGRQGRSVILLEKSLKEPDRIVGELLQPGGVAALEKLDLRDCLEEIDAIVVKGYQVTYYGEPVLIPYPASADDSSRKRPEGRSFHHGRFIQKLRAVAMTTPNVSVVESTATELVRCTEGDQVLGVKAMTNNAKDYYFAELTIIADGYASKFRKSHTSRSPVSKSKFYGLELHNADLPEPLHGHVLLGEGAPVLLYQISSEHTRALIDVPENLPSASVSAGGVKGHLENVVLPSLPTRVQPAFSDALSRKGAIRSMPNSWLPASTNETPGLILLGDALNMRHPLTGGGMTVAFNDVVLLRTLLSPTSVPNLGNVALVKKQMWQFHWRRKNLTSTINILAQALYALFAANDPQLKALQLGCFRYFLLGGQCVDGPVGLLAGITRAPLILFYHFFSVALFAIYIFIVEGPQERGIVVEGNDKDHVKHSAKSNINQDANDGVKVKDSTNNLPQPRDWVRMPLRALSSWAIFWKACVVLLPYIWSEVSA